MKQTPLFAAHQARGGVMEVSTTNGRGDGSQADAWMLAETFAGVEAEVRAIQTAAGVLDLAHVQTVQLVGPDARRFANGMFTNNVKHMAAGSGNRSCMTDDRGRLQGLLDVYCLAEDRFLCVLEGVDTAWFEKRYQMFIVFDDVEMELAPDEPWVLSVQGPAAAQVLDRMGLPVPEADHDHVGVGGEGGIRICRKDRTGHGGFDLLVPTTALATTWEALLASGAEPVGRRAADALRILAGRATWPDDAGDKTMVHELGLQHECVRFDGRKGCYIGQETINRVETQGGVNRRLAGLVADGPLDVGATVSLGDKVVGTVSSATVIDGRGHALAVLRNEACEPGTQVVAGGKAATTSALPFG